MRVALIGSGTVGRALAGRLSGRGDHVAVLSPEPVDLPGLWRRCDVASGEGLRKGVEGAQVVVYAAGTRNAAMMEAVNREGARHAAAAARRAGAERFVWVGPAGANAQAVSPSLRTHHEALALCEAQGPPLVKVFSPPLFGEHDHLLSPWLQRVRLGKAFRVPRGQHRLRPLWVGDLVKVLTLAVDGQQPDSDLPLQGPRAWTLHQLAEQVQSLTGGRRASLPTLLWGRTEAALRLPEQLEGSDVWSQLELGDRLSVQDYLKRWRRQHFSG